MRTGLELEYPDGSRTAASVGDVNERLGPYGARVWTLDLSGAPDEIRALLARPTLASGASRRVSEHFELPRTRLLELVSEAGREPQVADGGEMRTLDATHDIPYPELYVVAPGVDYSRFDRLHVNTAEDGTGVDEVLQMLSGRGVRVVQSLPEVGLVTLYLDCPSPDRGWIVTYSGGYPHIGSLTGADDGTKLLVQIMGPPVWTMNYVKAP